MTMTWGLAKLYVGGFLGSGDVRSFAVLNFVRNYAIRLCRLENCRSALVVVLFTTED
jgi:hypothetical protein